MAAPVFFEQRSLFLKQLADVERVVNVASDPAGVAAAVVQMVHDLNEFVQGWCLTKAKEQHGNAVAAWENRWLPVDRSMQTIHTDAVPQDQAKKLLQLVRQVAEQPFLHPKICPEDFVSNKSTLPVELLDFLQGALTQVESRIPRVLVKLQRRLQEDEAADQSGKLGSNSHFQQVKALTAERMGQDLDQRLRSVLVPFQGYCSYLGTKFPEASAAIFTPAIRIEQLIAANKDSAPEARIDPAILEQWNGLKGILIGKQGDYYQNAILKMRELRRSIEESCRQCMQKEFVGFAEQLRPWVQHGPASDSSSAQMQTDQIFSLLEKTDGPKLEWVRGKCDEFFKEFRGLPIEKNLSRIKELRKKFSDSPRHIPDS